MPLRAIIIAALMAASASFAAASEFFIPGQWLDETMPDLLKSSGVPGIAVAHIDVSDASPAVVRGYGFANIAKEQPVRGDTVFRIGSNSKTVTASTALTLIATMDLTLDTDLRPWLQELPIEPPLREALTFRNLLMQTGGFNERLFGQHTTIDEWRTLGPWLKSSLPPRFEAPGEVIAYVDYNTNVAGYALEQISGSGFEDLVEEQIFRPLGMTNSTFRQTDIPAHLRERMALSYSLLSDAPVPYRADAVLGTPGAGMFTSADDMALYLTQMLNAHAASSENTLDAAFRAQLQIGVRQHPVMPGRAPGFAEGFVNDMRMLYKDGQASGFNARMLVVPDSGIGFFIVNNASSLRPGGGFTPAHQMIRDFTDLWLERHVESLVAGSQALSLPPQKPEVKPLTAFTGAYRTTVIDRHRWEKLIALGDVIQVRAGPDNLRMSGRDWLPWGDSLFVAEDDSSLRRVFHVAGDSGRYLLIDGASYERIAVTEIPGVVISTLILSIVALIAGLGVATFARKRSGVLTIGAAIVALAFVIVTAALLLLTDPQRFFYGTPVLLRIASLLVWLATALASVAVIGAFLQRQQRLSAFLVATGALGLLVLAVQWRLAFAWSAI